MRRKGNAVKPAPALTVREVADAAARNPAKRIVSLGGGVWCYLVSLDGRYVRMRVDSVEFVDALFAAAGASERYCARLRDELASYEGGDFAVALDALDARLASAARGPDVE